MSLLLAAAADVPGYDPAALRVDVAQALLHRVVQPVAAIERVALRSALGRVLALDIDSPIDVPAHDNSAMDGYAFRGTDLLASPADTVLPVIGTALAGQPFDGVAPVGTCVRIMTGAMMPAGLDTVIPQESCRIDGPQLVIPCGSIRPGANRRLKGEDLAAGEAALRAGRILTPADLGLLASLAQAEIPVRRRLRVAFFSTGDELRSIGQPLDAGCVYDSNRYTLFGMLSRLDVERIDLGIVPDHPAAIESALRTACECADAVITSGGVSFGEADHTRRVSSALGEVLMWQMAMRPGRPMAVGRLESNGHQAWLFGLPGNPVAVMVTFYVFVRDALLQMAGAGPTPMPLLRAEAAHPIRKRPGRTEYQRGIVSRQGSAGEWQVSTTGSQGSGVLRSMSEANGLIVLPHDQGDVATGDRVDVMPLSGLI